MTTCRSALTETCRRVVCVAMVTSAIAVMPALATAKERGTASGDPTAMQSKIYRQAKAAYETNKFQECKRLLQSSVSLVPVMTLLLAQAECELKEYRACARHTAESLRWSGHEPNVRKGIEAMLAEATREIGSLLLTVNVGDAEASVDGQLVGITPIADPIYLDLGTRKLTVAKPGYMTISREVEAQRGTLVALNVDLSEESKAGRVVGSTDVDSPKAGVAYEQPKSDVAGLQEPPLESRSPNIAVLIAGGVVAAGGLVTGLYFNSQAHSEYGDGNALRDQVGPAGCAVGGGASRADCQTLLTHVKSGDRARNYSTVSFAVGATVLVGTVLYWLWPRHQTSRTDIALELTAAGAPGNAWVGISRTF